MNSEKPQWMPPSDDPVRTAEHARLVAQGVLAEESFSKYRPVLLESKTREFDEGWVYLYQSARFVETGDIADSLLENAPLFVPRNGASPCFISYHRSVADSMQAFRSCGNANACAIAQVRLSGWKPGPFVVPAIQAIRHHSPMSPAAAKEVIDACLAGNPAFVNTSTVTEARDLAVALASLQFEAEVTYGAQPNQH